MCEARDVRRYGILLYVNDELPAKVMEEGPRGRHASPPPRGGRRPSAERGRYGFGTGRRTISG